MKNIVINAIFKDSIIVEMVIKYKFEHINYSSNTFLNNLAQSETVWGFALLV